MSSKDGSNHGLKLTSLPDALWLKDLIAQIYDSMGIHTTKSWRFQLVPRSININKEGNLEMSSFPVLMVDMINRSLFLRK